MIVLFFGHLDLDLSQNVHHDLRFYLQCCVILNVQHSHYHNHFRVASVFSIFTDLVLRRQFRIG